MTVRHVDTIAAPRVAIVHNWMWKMRGAEKTLLEFCRIYPDADLYMLFGTLDGIHEDITRHHISFSWLNKLPWISRIYQWTYLLWPLVTERWDFSEYDFVISSSASTVKGVITSVECKHVSYIYTPMRYIWDQQKMYASKRSWLVRPWIYLLNHFLRIWDVMSTTRIDKVISISSYVTKRIEKYYGIKVDKVIYPPVDFKSIDSLELKANLDEDDYFIVVSGFEENKGAREAVEYSIESGINLKLVGEGTQRKALEKISRAHDNIEFLGWLEDVQLYSYLKNARALLFLGVEDFGIVPVESVYLGTPVIAYNRGGVVDTVIEGKNGILIDEVSTESLNEAVRRFDSNVWDRQQMRNTVQKFSTERFRKEIIEFVSV